MEFVSVDVELILIFKDCIVWHRKCFLASFSHSFNNRKNHLVSLKMGFHSLKFNCLLCIHSEISNLPKIG